MENPGKQRRMEAAVLFLVFQAPLSVSLSLSLWLFSDRGESTIIPFFWVGGYERAHRGLPARGQEDKTCSSLVVVDHTAPFIGSLLTQNIGMENPSFSHNVVFLWQRAGR